MYNFNYNLILIFPYCYHYFCKPFNNDLIDPNLTSQFTDMYYNLI